ncbi:hypothetical protein RRF85_25080, partial [Escherichia coli]|nr:hypothetical protein [Escherichia coli]
GYNTTKNHEAFVTKTLVNKDGDIQRRIMAMFSKLASGRLTIRCYVLKF